MAKIFSFVASMICYQVVYATSGSTRPIVGATCTLIYVVE